MKRTAELALTALLTTSAAACAAGSGHNTGPTQSPSPALACPTFKHPGVANNPNTLPSTTGADRAVSGTAAEVMGNFTSYCADPNQYVSSSERRLTIVPIGSTALQLVETVSATGGFYTETLTVDIAPGTSGLAGIGNITAFGVSDTVTKGNNTTTRITTTLTGDHWETSRHQPGYDNGTYDSHGSAHDQQQTAAAMEFNGVGLLVQNAIGGIAANAAPFGA